MSFMPPLPFYAQVTLFLIQGSQPPIMIKWMDFQPMQWCNPYKGDCFSIVESPLE